MDNQQQRPPKGRNVQRLNVLYLMNYIVYKTTNLINGKIYVGVHRTNPDIFDGYIGCGVFSEIKNRKNKLKGFPKAVQKYGYNNFKREILFIYPDTPEGEADAYDKERDIVDIDFVKSSYTYNLIVGGKYKPRDTITCTKKISQYTLNGEFIRTWDSIVEAEESLNLNSIYNCLIGNSKYAGDFQWKYYTDESNIDSVERKEKVIYQFDLSGNLIKVWKSASIASKEFKNQNAARAAIHNVCNKITRQAYGFYWSFKCKFEYKPYDTKVAIARYDLDGTFLESYTSVKEAMEAFGMKHAGNLYGAIKGEHKTLKGFRWRFFYGDTKNIKPLKDKDIVSSY